MYHFKIDGVDCGCDTLGELVAVCRFGPDPAPDSDLDLDLDLNSAGKTCQEISKLPLVKGSLTWKVVKQIGEKIGRKDFRRLRSDLKNRQSLG